MLVAFSVAPSGSVPSPGPLTDGGSAADGGSADGSVTQAVAAAVRVVRASGLPNRTDAMFTTIEGDWDACMAVVRAAVEAVAPYGQRVSLVLKADIRPGWTGELDAKLARLESAVGEPAHDDAG